MRTYRLIASGVAVALLAAACQSAAPPPVQDVPAQSDTAELQPSAGAPESAQAPPTEAPEPQSSLTMPAVPVEVEIPGRVGASQGLAATDPATVNLANGSPTFVEFFAFW